MLSYEAGVILQHCGVEAEALKVQVPCCTASHVCRLGLKWREVKWHAGSLESHREMQLSVGFADDVQWVVGNGLTVASWCWSFIGQYGNQSQLAQIHLCNSHWSCSWTNCFTLWTLPFSPINEEYSIIFLIEIRCLKENNLGNMRKLVSDTQRCSQEWVWWAPPWWDISIHTPSSKAQGTPQKWWGRDCLSQRLGKTLVKQCLLPACQRHPHH